MGRRGAQTALRLVPQGSNVETVISALQAVDEEERAEWNQDQRWRACAALVFAYWAKRLRHSRALLDDKREGQILARLRENHGDVSELLYAIDGARRDEFFRRKPEAARITVLFRDREHVEHLAELVPECRDGVVHPLALKYGVAT